jgi:hypothetical protein
MGDCMSLQWGTPHSEMEGYADMKCHAVEEYLLNTWANTQAGR